MNVHGYFEPRLILLAAAPFFLFAFSNLFDNERRQHGALVLVWAAYISNLTRLIRRSRECLAFGSAFVTIRKGRECGGPWSIAFSNSLSHVFEHCI